MKLEAKARLVATSATALATFHSLELDDQLRSLMAKGGKFITYLNMWKSGPVPVDHLDAATVALTKKFGKPKHANNWGDAALKVEGPVFHLLIDGK